MLLALLLQATYGAVDLLVVGQFASSADVSAVATGSNIMMTLTGPLSSFAMGITVILGRQIGSIFRGIGDSKTPLIAVAIACVCNIFGDLFLVAVCHLGAAGAALATVISQGISVLISLLLIRKKTLPFAFSWKMVRIHLHIWRQMTVLGLPLAVSDLLVGVSFMVIQAIVNSLGLVPSAGIGVAEKVCAFIMLVPSSSMQSMAAFTAQNLGAGKTKRALRAVYYGIAASLAAGIIIGTFTFFRGDLLCGIFSKDAQVIVAGADYLKAYAIDCLLTAVFFVFFADRNIIR